MVAHFGITKPLIIRPPSFDISEVHWHNLTNGEAALRLISQCRLCEASGLFQASRGGWRMTGELHTVAETAQILKVRESWLKTKASARLVPCTFVGKHLRFSDDDIAEIMRVGARQPVTRRRRSASSGT
jgi:hypothetical protein